MNKKIILIGIAVILFVAFLGWLFMESSKPLPGQKIDDLGRGHVQIGENVDYNSNPPTSGKHYEEWIRAGVYDEEKDDRNLVHSLEHGYVILSYNCDRKVQSLKFNVQSVYAHGIEEEGSSSADATASGEPSAAFKSEDCHNLVDQLISAYEKKGKKKLIVIPRPGMDSRIALTAWNYLDKFDQFNEVRVEKFIDAHLDMGPEKTME